MRGITGDSMSGSGVQAGNGRAGDGRTGYGRVADGREASAARRPRLARALQRVGALQLIGRLRAALRHDVRILAYHRVLESVEPPDFRFDLDLISASSDVFRQQVDIIKRRCSPMRFDELIDRLDRGQSLPRRAALITFDDGYDDNYRIAWPILRDAGVSAMFFVSTGHIESGRPYAYDWLTHMVCVTRADRLQVPELAIDRALPDTLRGRRVIASELLDRIKTLDANAQQALIARMQRDWSLPSESGHPDCRPMTWAQLREMRDGGMEVGSHGVDHQMLAKMTPVAMREELVASKSAIERALGGEVQVISYPVGGSDAYDAAVIETVRDAGYRLGCSYRAGPESMRPESRYDLRRIPVERDVCRDWFEGMLALPEVFCYRSRSRR